jgi:hypothetical protein
VSFKFGYGLEFAVVPEFKIGFPEPGRRFPVFIRDKDLDELKGNGDFMLEGLLVLLNLIRTSSPWAKEAKEKEKKDTQKESLFHNGLPI